MQRCCQCVVCQLLDVDQCVVCQLLDVDLEVVSHHYLEMACLAVISLHSLETAPLERVCWTCHSLGYMNVPVLVGGVGLGPRSNSPGGNIHLLVVMLLVHCISRGGWLLLLLLLLLPPSPTLLLRRSTKRNQALMTNRVWTQMMSQHVKSRHWTWILGSAKIPQANSQCLMTWTAFLELS